ncbi:glycoside hydrolase family 99-like domain-containing protein [Cellulomonas sp. ACRRI]|uniref:glycosyltransferase WbsX family protein n=1 Tax=Cellulomonas sp. ACRRI TaxID=2918188 RepID=UPI001EF25B67|nr:glycoside hydrolase family 99-like domain-containing protein [Cellulomonas sp. ACRRI]MCG7284907.1 glycoside hydrolase family 99-like domain-containing protein [Cellulomonas sp. ACRRI]
MDLGARAIAFYLPQYHPVPENDAWWGPGFTEWTNTVRARPLFPGHRQPHLPGDLGFYDLRVPEARAAQADLARAHGVAAFVYWHYWFGGGRRLLERPFAEVLASGEPTLPFCLAWANETWTGTWHGAPDRVLAEQTYPEGDDHAHLTALLPAFRDERYLRVGDRPVLVVHKPGELPDARRFVDRWQALARAAGLPGLYLVAEVSDWFDWGEGFPDAEAVGFDAGIQMRLPVRFGRREFWRRRIGRRLGRGPEHYPVDPGFLERRPLPPTRQPCVMPNWDNTPRSGRRGIVMTGSSPDVFRRHVADATALLAGRPEQERLLWVKSWNEWAEGNYLEPDAEHGTAWLEALHEGLQVPATRVPAGRAADPAPA